MNLINRYISKKSIEILKKDEISGIKGRFSFNLGFTENELRKVVDMICHENAIPLNTDSEEDIEFINEMVEEFYED